MGVRFTVDDDELDRKFDQLADLGAAVRPLERILAQQYAVGQAAVHVQTGSLRNSEKIGSKLVGGRWEGEIAFGGESDGFPNDPVVYAAYEAARGSAHDFTQPIRRLSGRYLQAVRDHLTGRP